jgi:hypothetical protein
MLDNQPLLTIGQRLLHEGREQIRGRMIGGRRLSGHGIEHRLGELLVHP